MATGGESRVKLVLHDRVGSQLSLVQVAYSISGQTVFEANTIGDQKLVAASGAVVLGAVDPGRQSFEAKLTFRGNGFGVFAYLRKYRFTVASRLPRVLAQAGSLLCIETRTCSKMHVPLQEQAQVLSKVRHDCSE